MREKEKLMNHTERVSEHPGREHKPYEKPAIVYRQPLEARASVCNTGVGGKSDATCTIAFS